MGDHLRRRRLDEGLTQRTLARRWGVRPETVANWELGRTRPTIRRLAKIIALLGGDPEPASETLSSRLLTLRRRLGLTQAELATRLGQDAKQVCRWEQGSLRPHPWIASRLDLELRVLEGRPVETSPTLSFFDLTRWRRKPPKGLAILPETFGERLRAHRLGLGLSMADLGRRVGVSRGVIYRLERGRQEAPDELRGGLERVLDEPSRRPKMRRR